VPSFDTVYIMPIIRFTLSGTHVTYNEQKLWVNYDIIFLQEHWLLPCELNTLSNIHTEFLAFGVSAVDISSNVIRGRPYGGTAMLYRKQFTPVVDARLCAVTIKHVKVLSCL